MKRTNKIIYWIATGWLALGMTSSGIVQLLKLKEETAFILSLGYPDYLLTILGIFKLAGVLVILAPRLPLVKEWAYAGFFFMMTGAVWSHLASGAPATDAGPALFLLALTTVSWYFRPASRKLALNTESKTNTSV